MNWESEKDMARDVEENKEMYEALSDEDDDFPGHWMKFLRELRIEDEDGNAIVELEIEPDMVSFDHGFVTPNHGGGYWGELADGERKTTIRINDLKGYVTGEIERQSNNEGEE